MEYRNAFYSNVEKTRIDCEINHPDYGWIPYTLDPNDADMTVNNDDLLMSMEEKGDIADYIPPTPLTEKALGDIERRKRQDLLLKYVDPLVCNPIRWSSMSEGARQEVMDYRQELLDITEQEGFPYTHIWPVF